MPTSDRVSTIVVHDRVKIENYSFKAELRLGVATEYRYLINSSVTADVTVLGQTQKFDRQSYEIIIFFIFKAVFEYCFGTIYALWQ